MERQASIWVARSFFASLMPAGREGRIKSTRDFANVPINFPGYFGGFGRFLFRKYFLEREYADLMRGVLNGYKADAEQRPAGDG